MATLFVYRSTRPKNLSFLTGLTVMLAVLAGVSFWGAHHISAASCTTNDIMKCGFSSPSDFISKVEANNNGVNSNADLQAIYAHYGLSQADYDDFAAHAVQGEAMRDGSIVVNGKTVGTGGMSIGRSKSFQGSNPFAVSINGQTYWGNVNSQAFASGVNEIPVFVLLDSSGGLKFAVMPSCGNPEFPASKPTPPPTVQAAAACKVLNEQPVQGQQNTFSFTAAATKSGSATITRYVYDFGDGSPTQTETSGDTPVTHTYSTSGTFTAKVTVFARLSSNGQEQQLPVVITCSKQITITPPQKPTPPPAVMAACKDLVGLPRDDSGSKLSFTFVATAVPNSQLTLSGADFDFGDGTSQLDEPANPDGMTVSIDKTYANAGTFTVSAVLRFTSKDNVNKLVTAPPCTTIVTPVVPAVTPPAPPPVVHQAVAATTPPPTQPLPNTGAGNVIGLFFAVTAIGTFIFRQLLLRRVKSGE